MRRHLQGGAVAERIVAVDPVEDETWADLSRNHGSLFSSPRWLGAMQDTYDFDLIAWVTRGESGDINGGIPLARLGEEPWQRVSALPFSDYCNPIDLDGASWPVLADRLVAEGLPAEVRCLGDDAAVSDPRFDPVDPPDLWHAVTLDPDEDRAWAGLSSSARRAVRKGRDSGVVVRPTDDLDSLREFYELHLGTRKDKYRLLAQPHELFTSLHKRFGDDMILLGAWQEDSLVAGILLLVWGDTLYYKFNASSPDALAVRPNDLLMWEATRLGVSRGLSTLDLGRTDADHDSLARYKAKYATSESRIHSMRHGSYRRDPSIGAILGPLTELLTRPEVPSEITEEAGRLVYHHFA
jgi:CelD/BcsL family acetyltransferase involved in cellulose biosynthesis